eukprot:CAMPEP_0119319034 /NCGR_PEP_ID=MMETSP1333-20130426/48314_1 /TAXON_ID=418940 /ORGANISM="Scyphosphaera apsteinii, Strain RCC1455" /LENGTH=367 /DNA_ID=CAMNT_0007325355 /DNA_START=253 /DNA_END=1357 /DNA_ORIENTATION=+
MPFPGLGFGGHATLHGHPKPEVAIRMATTAISMGVRHFDTALHYGNLASVGEALKKLPRSSTWITSKVSRCSSSESALSCATRSERTIALSLSALKVAFVDLLLVHSTPSGSREGCNEAICRLIRAQWAVMERARADGRVGVLGVVNFCEQCLECLRSPNVSLSPVIAYVHMFLGFGFNSQGEAGRRARSLREYTRGRGIRLAAISPLSSVPGHLTRLFAVQECVRQHQISPIQVPLAWLHQAGVPFVFASRNASHQAENVATTLRDFPVLTDPCLRMLNNVSMDPSDHNTTARYMQLARNALLVSALSTRSAAENNSVPHRRHSRLARAAVRRSHRSRALALASQPLRRMTLGGPAVLRILAISPK